MQNNASVSVCYIVLISSILCILSQSLCVALLHILPYLQTEISILPTHCGIFLSANVFAHE